MDQEIEARFSAQDKKLEEIYTSVEKGRKYFLWTLIITVATIVLPILALVMVLPWFVKMLTSSYGL